MDIFANERQRKIYELIQKEGAVTCTSLVHFFGVSLETIRRDLLTLEKNGKLTRVHGGAIAHHEMMPFMELKERHKNFSEQKYALSVKAAEFIQDGDVIAIDSGSTAISFAEVLKERFSKLTIISHSVDVFELLCNYKNFSVILSGGHYLREEKAFYGQLALEALDKLHAHKAFIFPSAVSLKYGIADYQKEMYQMQKKLIEISDEIFILADSSKFEKTGLLKVCDINPNYTYITDNNLKKEFVKLYEENNLKLCNSSAMRQIIETDASCLHVSI